MIITRSSYTGWTADNSLTQQGLEGVRVNSYIIAGLNTSNWTGSDHGMETVLIGSVVDPVHLAIGTHKGVRALDNDRLFALAKVLQCPSFRPDLTITQFVSVFIEGIWNKR